MGQQRVGGAPPLLGEDANEEEGEEETAPLLRRAASGSGVGELADRQEVASKKPGAFSFSDPCRSLHVHQGVSSEELCGNTVQSAEGEGGGGHPLRG